MRVEVDVRSEANEIFMASGMDGRATTIKVWSAIGPWKGFRGRGGGLWVTEWWGNRPSGFLLGWVGGGEVYDRLETLRLV